MKEEDTVWLLQAMSHCTSAGSGGEHETGFLHIARDNNLSTDRVKHIEVVTLPTLGCQWSRLFKFMVQSQISLGMPTSLAGPGLAEKVIEL